ncbi:MAG: phosphoadenylyl-sulfate reductase [Thermoplasmata archaeon]|nr:phosphoadenylyl-sulfate reductase [Thermoplasmata archaeon]
MSAGSEAGMRSAAELSKEWEGLETRELLRRARARFGPRLAVGSGFGKDSVVLLHLLRSEGLNLPVLFLDTGYHFPETIAYRELLARELALEVVDISPEETVAEQDERLGAALYERNPDFCCELRKVRPLRAALGSYTAWFTGVRRDQSPGRATAPLVEWQQLSAEGRGVFKVNPLATWSRRDVQEYLARTGLPPHPLADRGFPSIGCGPCTRAVAPGMPERAGRWAGTEKSECGIHSSAWRTRSSTGPSAAELVVG